MSKPYNYFLNTIERAENLLQAADEHEDILSDDLARGSVILSVAAFDHYFTSKFCDVLNNYLKNNKPNKKLIERLERAGLNTEMALELAVMKRPFRRIRSLLSKSLSGVTTNQTKAIENLFSAIDLDGLSGRIHKHCNRKNLGRRIEKLVIIRNEVSHCAHINSHGQPKAIDAEDVGARIEELKLFVDSSEIIINQWVKDKKMGAVSSATD
ncbi:HEPN domain-containing protein [Sulfitobacter sp. AS59]|uniref:HEPN domain-containing protein n=1 Tax=Sulfitobacter sp. AS59 TaxID=3135784 RepID=UPI00317381D3